MTASITAYSRSPFKPHDNSPADVDTVLVVDDDEGYRLLISSYLEANGYRTTTARNGLEGIELAREVSPSIILTDLHMAPMNGSELLHELQRSHVTARIPVIMFTGDNDPASERSAMVGGADDYLIKPFAARTLLDAVEARLKRHRLVCDQTGENFSMLVDIVEATMDLACLADAQTLQLRYLNWAGRRMLGLNATQSVNLLTLNNIIFASNQEAGVREMLDLARSKGGWLGDSEVMDGAGQVIPVSLQILYHGNHRAGRDSYSLVARNVIERKQMEGALRRNEELFRLITEHAAEWIALFDRDGNVEYDSSLRRGSCGIPPESLAARPFLARLANDCSTKFLQLLENVYSQLGQHSFDLCVDRDDGMLITMEAWLGPLSGTTGTVETAILVAHDVTQKRLEARQNAQLEIQLRQAQKLEAIGQLAAGIAHEINTPTQYIGDNLRFVLETFRDLGVLLTKLSSLLGPAAGSENDTGAVVQSLREELKNLDLGFLLQEIPTALEQSREGVARVSCIVKAMKEFSHPGGTEKSPVDLNRCVESTVTVTRNEWKYVADLELKLDAALPEVECHPGELNQVILNLIINAVHAIAERVGNDGSKKGRITVATEAKGSHVQISVSDTGCGMPASIQERVFDPFFTTKPVGKGTGQGLAIARSVVVDKHAGRIWVQSAEGVGTTLFILLPVKAPEPTTKTKKEER